MNKLLITGLLLSLVGCGSSYEEEHFSAIPPELADCKFFTLRDDMSYLRVVRCPMSETTVQYSSGKSKRTAVTIDGVEYEKAGKANAGY